MKKENTKKRKRTLCGVFTWGRLSMKMNNLLYLLLIFGRILNLLVVYYGTIFRVDFALVIFQKKMKKRILRREIFSNLKKKSLSYARA